MKGRTGRRTTLPPGEETEAGLNMNIQDCPSGCVCLSFGAAAIHLQPEEFVHFMGLAAKALSRLMNRGAMEPAIPDGLLIQ